MSDPAQIERLIEKLERIAKCIYIAVEESVADDIASACREAASALRASHPEAVPSAGASEGSDA